MKAPIESVLREFIATNLLYADGDFPVRDDESLIERGVIDSTGIMELVEYVSQQFEIEVPVKDVNQENFDSIFRLTNYVRRRLGERVALGPSADASTLPLQKPQPRASF